MKKTIKKTKRWPVEWEKILFDHITDKGLISTLYKELIQLNIKQLNFLKMGRGTKLAFLQNGTQMANR